MDHLLHVIMVLAALAAFFVAPLPVAVLVSAVVAGASVALFIAARRARNAPVRMGIESLVGETATVIEWERHTGLVRHRGELWRAASREPFRVKEHVRIVAVDGTLLHVQRVPSRS
jgi:membrane protein implicated in regulation of membrane protease activity